MVSVTAITVRAPGWLRPEANPVKFQLSIVAIFAALLVASPMAAAAGSEKFYPDWYGSVQENAYKTNPSTDNVANLPDGGLEQVWCLDLATPVDAAFGADGWPFMLALDTEFRGSYNIRVGYADDSTDEETCPNFVGVGGSSFTEALTNGPLTGSIDPMGAFTVPAGKHLAFGVHNVNDVKPGCNVGTTAQKNACKAKYNLNIRVGMENTWFQSPENSVNYPTPELGTIILAGAGLAVVGTVILRRK